ncbi:hypothetical protein [Rouxiella badensis]|uniref:hypothetical protein n=1 Tax=Rouxiella badensis TaxID=1646377 RepID=UPI001F1073A8|nr:hypothetical protein [Rouxiella badensis]
MDKFDRSLQKDLLQLLYDNHPESLHPMRFKELVDLFGGENPLASNLIYLNEHGLITNCLNRGINDFVINTGSLFITNKGIDFMRNDGGLSSILNVQTVKFHDSTITALEDIISVANLPEEKKSGLISRLRELPADAIKHLTLQLLTKGVLSLPAALPLIEKALQQH